MILSTILVERNECYLGSCCVSIGEIEDAIVATEPQAEGHCHRCPCGRDQRLEELLDDPCCCVDYWRGNSSSVFVVSVAEACRM